MSYKSSRHAITFGRDRIAFILVLGDHDRFQITVQPDMKVEVQAPAGKSLEAIFARIQRRAAWISKQLQYFEQFQPHPTAKQFVSGETFRYLGRQYRLKLISSGERRVHLSRPFLMIHLPNPKNARAVELQLREWYRERAKIVFANRLDAIYENTQRHLPDKPTLRIQRMVRRWGSCSTQNFIILNTLLIQVPVRCIDYVIVHEICHLRFHDHGANFLRLLGRFLPDWEQVKRSLESISVA